MIYKLTSSFTPIQETEGTLYAPEREVEIATEEVKGSGLILPARVPMPYKGTIYARAVSSHATLNHIHITLPTGA